MPEVELTWLLKYSEEDREPGDLLANYYSEVANGPMKDYRWIIQSGNKQGQNYYVHVLDGITVLHKLRVAQVVEMNDLEERLLFVAYTIHDMNKNPLYGGRDSALSYANIVTPTNIRAELTRIEMERFFFDWDQYVEDIKLLMLLHQHDAAPLVDLNVGNHQYKLPHKRLQELGKLMYAVDNLDLSHTLSEKNHKQNALTSINAVADRHWRWVTHRLGENRAVLSNLIHNTVVEYLQTRYTRDEGQVIVDLLYYPDGVAYLLPEREAFSWSESENSTLAQLVATALKSKQAASLHQLIKASQLGIRVSQAGIESGASYTTLLHEIRKRVESKAYTQTWHAEYNQKLRPDLEAAVAHTDQAISVLATTLLSQSEVVVPYEPNLLKRGELALAYYNLLNDHLKEKLNKMRQCDPWTHVYRQLNLPPEKYVFYNQVNHYRRAYFIARDSQENRDTLFERILVDLAELTGEDVPDEMEETGETSAEEEYLQAYLSKHLEFQTTGYTRDFLAHLRHYSRARHKQCCMCSSSSPTVKLMGSEVPAHMGVQVFSNRLRGGSGEPKRNVCPICRMQLVVEKLTRMAFKKGDEKHSNFYLHLYPYAFFTRSYQDAIYSTLKNIVHEDNRCFYLRRDGYYQAWGRQFDQSLNAQMARQARRSQEKREDQLRAGATKVNGVSVPLFSEAISNTPTLPLNAPGENYTQQFIFALTHALMISDFFGCRVALSRTPFPLLSNDYLVDHELAFFIDGVPLNLRWLLPTNEYRSIETYREGQEKDGGAKYVQHRDHWQNERPDEQGYAAYENIFRRLALLYLLPQQLGLSAEDGEQFLVELAMALANDPFSAYHVVDLAIEKQVRGARSKSEERDKQKGKRGGNDKSGVKQHIAPEQRAIFLSKRVAPLLEELVKE